MYNGLASWTGFEESIEISTVAEADAIRRMASAPAMRGILASTICSEHSEP
jgi:hypothetical protein